VVERGRLMGLVSIGDVVKMRIAEVEMETTATREYAGYCQEEGYQFVPASLRSGLHHERRQTYAFRNGWAEGRPDIGADWL